MGLVIENYGIEFLDGITQPGIATASYLRITAIEVATTYGCNCITSPFRTRSAPKRHAISVGFGTCCCETARPLRYYAKAHQVLANETKYTL
jgi:hypothetical protein